ncbi:hypothetical protein GCK72_021718 [Caenorhabditis remanei]|uniref:F-box domain-containing protein n=1 Tax=Caenorhabditis remanei TaxID=31234 RepID=A0A6A5GLJ2_CAERE|nr:hypothetical protein GCK72_021718 [Caenorhabditis remanei]KAF1755149.1 hypothetical protein GCK72_021718 [Caenorhabditis remanei]
MHKIPLEFLKTNTNYLKSCILYDVALNVPIFNAYRNFCEGNGDDAMGYNDYEYWYYRFYSGDVDFEHERRIDSREKTLTELPVEILGMMTGYLEPEERVDLRLTSKKFKAIVDMEPVTFKQIAVELRPNALILCINENSFEYKNDNGRFIRNGYADEGLETALDRFAQVLKHPKLRIDRLALILPADLFPEERELLLKSLPHSLHVNTARVLGSVEETLTIVSHLKPGVLKELWITGCPQQLTPIFESEHWKQAELTKLSSGQIYSKSFPFFYNFERFEISVILMELVDVQLLINNIAKNPSFKHCSLKAFIFNLAVFVNGLNMEDTLENPGIITYRYPVPNSTGYLEIRLFNNGISIDRRH